MSLIAKCHQNILHNIYDKLFLKLVPVTTNSSKLFNKDDDNDDDDDDNDDDDDDNYINYK